MSSEREWEPTRWWRVLMADGTVWMETSDGVEAQLEAHERGYRLEHLWREVPRGEWREVN